jgi:hypothetical protein
MPLHYDMNDLLDGMMTAARKTLNASWMEVKPFAELEFRHFTESLALISALKDGGRITEEQARLHMDIQRDASLSVLLAIRAMGKVAAENAINAAISVIRAPVNKALGWALL